MRTQDEEEKGALVPSRLPSPAWSSCPGSSSPRSAARAAGAQAWRSFSIATPPDLPLPAPARVNVLGDLSSFQFNQWYHFEEESPLDAPRWQRSGPCSAPAPHGPGAAAALWGRASAGAAAGTPSRSGSSCPGPRLTGPGAARGSPTGSPQADLHPGPAHCVSPRRGPRATGPELTPPGPRARTRRQPSRAAWSSVVPFLGSTLGTLHPWKRTAEC
ncbi:nematocyst expressed protein 3-like [Nycticebus coucang]|uniref:nematocyst expressed protein 3-like n=1 Tax=Nycticebus coucang TaxID=9470 RepID=UPI00234C170F|nr:nematocyst expressed protein 3-like [Nycticebus coucang]